jgi:putative ABC transport system substrate-binding protein
MRRREVIGGLGAAAAWPRAARAQQSALPVVGYLGPGTLESARAFTAAFLDGLVATGYLDGRDVIVEYRWADRNYDRLPALARELVARQPAVIVTGGATPNALAAKAVTDSVPIVFVLGSDPVEFWLVRSFASPGGNVTGVTVLDVELVAKALEAVHALVPTARIIAVLVNPSNMLAAAQIKGAQEAARDLGVHALIVEASNEREVEHAFATLSKDRADALLVTGEPFFFGPARDQLIALAAYHRVPTVYLYRQFTAAGGLMSYGTNLADAHRLSGVYAGRILKGEKPADLPVQRSTRVELSINLKTAKNMGLDVPSSILARADEVIE